MTYSSSSNIPLLTTTPTEMSFLDQALSNGVFISVVGRLQQKLGKRLTKRTVQQLFQERLMEIRSSCCSSCCSCFCSCCGRIWSFQNESLNPNTTKRPLFVFINFRSVRLPISKDPNTATRHERTTLHRPWHQPDGNGHGNGNGNSSRNDN